MFSAIILTFNSIRYIQACLDSLFKQDHQAVEVIVVDNGSTDGTVDFIKNNYPGVILVRNKNNLGASKARNQGIEIARGKWILCLDCDTVLNKDFLYKALIIINEMSPDIGMLQPKMLSMFRKTIYSCGIYLSPLRRFYDMGRGQVDNGQFDSSKYIFGACSAAALYRKQMLEDVKEETGYFDERFLFLVEDVDLSWRAQRKNWKAFFYPELICYHYGNSSCKGKTIRQYFCFRNRLFLIAKNEKFNAIVKKIPLYLIYDLPRFITLMIKYNGNMPLNKTSQLLKK